MQRVMGKDYAKAVLHRNLWKCAFKKREKSRNLWTTWPDPGKIPCNRRLTRQRVRDFFRPPFFLATGYGTNRCQYQELHNECSSNPELRCKSHYSCRVWSPKVPLRAEDPENANVIKNVILGLNFLVWRSGTASNSQSYEANFIKAQSHET